jgi:hypothetical protein
MLFKDPGILGGHINSQLVKVSHLKSGPSGFKVFWDGREYSWLYAGLVEEKLGIKVNSKQRGPQKGYPSEAVTRAVWRNLVTRYNQHDPDVKLL